MRRALVLIALGWLLVGCRMLPGPVTSVAPAIGADEVPVTQAIVFTLRQPVAEPLIVELTPPVDGVTTVADGTVRFTPAEPLRSGTQYSAELVRPDGHRLRGAGQTTFTTRAPAVGYLAPDEANRLQISLQHPVGTVRQLTQHEGDVMDVAVAPDGRALAYVVAADDGTNTLWELDPWRDAPPVERLACGEQPCRRPAWFPGTDRLIFDRGAVGAPDIERRLWWLDDSGEPVPVFADEAVLGFQPRPAPDGLWLAFNQSAEHDLVLYNISTGASTLLHNHIAMPAVWHPRGGTLLANELVFRGDRFGVHLLHYELATQTVSLISETFHVDDGQPAWSPDGSTIAFGRKQPRAPMGRQIWLSDAEGDTTRPITDNSTQHHGVLSWSLDGTALLYQAFDVSQPTGRPTVRLLDIATGVETTLADPGYFPFWIP